MFFGEVSKGVGEVGYRGRKLSKGFMFGKLLVLVDFMGEFLSVCYILVLLGL